MSNIPNENNINKEEFDPIPPTEEEILQLKPLSVFLSKCIDMTDSIKEKLSQLKIPPDKIKMIEDKLSKIKSEITEDLTSPEVIKAIELFDKYLAQLKKEIITKKKEKQFIIPKEIGQLVRAVLTPDLPLILHEDKQYTFSYVYDKQFASVSINVNKETLKRLNVSDEDLKLRDVRFENTIADWISDKKAREGTNEIRGSIEELTRDILGKKTPREEDYKKVEVNLKTLASRQYVINHREKGKDILFMVIHPFEFNNHDKTFRGWVYGIVPKVAGEVRIDDTAKKILYITKTLKDIYPKQNLYEYWLRQYLTEIKNINQDIPRIRGGFILEKAGYTADLYFRRKKYRNKEAEKIIEKFIELGREYGLFISYHKGHEKIKDVRRRYLFIKASYKQDLKTLSAPDILKRDSFIKELAVWINKDPRYPDLAICENRAKKLVNRYGYLKVKEIYERHLPDENFNINLLEHILKTQ